MKENSYSLLNKSVFDFLLSYAKSNVVDCELDSSPRNSMFWMKGLGDHHWSKTDRPMYFQTVEYPLYQVNTFEIYNLWLKTLQASTNLIL